ncbi:MULTISPECIES: hypothetical protein [unclassified Campylobacter]|uniref:hypothetical protein n=1 Tax=unclassified Campylobacter TaxID=2593542 RepID=UPI00224B163E|nr:MULTISPECIES: hypothetical protein [unclassified Campylobacter]MCX2683733.1 hypothetical protein [Campylobacter sp. MIT 21-1684]MCX2752002.1 hypothetical protein [Campylobacter sp. MIT 21-1682]
MIGQMIDIGPGLGRISTLSLNTKGFTGISASLSALKFSFVYSTTLNTLSTVRGDLKIRISNIAAGGLSVALTAVLGIQRGTEAKDNIGSVQTAGVTTLKGAMAVMDVDYN